MGFMKDKKGVILGVANDRSLAWMIAKRFHDEGAELAFNHLPGEKMERRVRRLAEPIGAKLIAPCDVSQDQDLEQFFGQVGETLGHVDFLVHAIAFAQRECLTNRFWLTKREHFREAMDISCYSLIGACQKSFELFREGATVLSLSYLGAVRFMPGYNVMGLCKAGLESAVRYLAADLGDLKRIRVNAISAGPIRTLSASGVKDFNTMLDNIADRAPLRRNVTAEEVGDTCLFLVGPHSRGITGTTIFVDAGFHIMGI